MNLKLWPAGTAGRTMGSVMLLLLAVATYLLLRAQDERPVFSRTQALLIESAITQQAMHERDSIVNVRSRNTVLIRRSPTYQCVDLRNREIEVSSTYCYRVAGENWKLISERVGTR